MGQFDGEDGDAQDLLPLQTRAKNLSTERLEIEIAELSHEIDFLQEQIDNDLGSYPLKQLELASQKVSVFRQKCEILKVERQKRS